MRILFIFTQLKRLKIITAFSTKKMCVYMIYMELRKETKKLC